MKVFKFGGASVKNVKAIKNVAKILNKYQSDDCCVVVSAMGKTTNALEKIVEKYFLKKEDAKNDLEKLKLFHYRILDELFESKKNKIYDEVNNLFVEIDWAIEDESSNNFDFEYDQIVSVGELLSTKIINAFLQQFGLKSKWIDVRDVIRTDNTYREGKVDWKITGDNITNIIGNCFEKDNGIVVTQGFIGCTSENFTTTLGREGSDYSAAILAYGLNAENMTIWKDVPGMLNADPKWFSDTQKLSHISYREAIELAYYGATVIHPKTIKPLQNKSIPLFVKSFLDDELDGTLIDDETSEDSLIPSYIFKINQLLVSISPKDFSFIVEENLEVIFGLFAKYRVKVNMMQNSAINFSVCIDNEIHKTKDLFADLRKHYKVWLNDDLELVTVRHYNEETIKRVTEKKEILVEQKSRNTARFVMKNIN